MFQPHATPKSTRPSTAMSGSRVHTLLFAAVVAMAATPTPPAYAAMAMTAGTAAIANTVEPPPGGDQRSIDGARGVAVIQALLADDPALRRQAIDAVMASPQSFAPPVFYVMSQALFAEGDRDTAAFWFYAGQLRARFDANRCLDVSARSAVAALNEGYGPDINRHAYQDLDKLEALMAQVVAWDRKTPHDYDHRWINLHGMAAMQSQLGAAADTATSVPEAQWPALAEETRTRYLSSFHAVLAEMRAPQ